MIRLNKVLVVAAHPDDELLGCGATVCSLNEQNLEIHSLILGEGLTSRQKIRDEESLKDEIRNLHACSQNAAIILGNKSTTNLHFPDNRFDSVALLDIVKKIEQKIGEIEPDTIFTHYGGDLNIDHQITFKAVLTACRPLKNQCVKRLLSFETPSATEWQSSHAGVFSPNYFFALEKRHIETKCKALAVYPTEVQSQPHPRSLEHIQKLAQVRGATIGRENAEAFILIRAIHELTK